jgi:hypothetical protein
MDRNTEKIKQKFWTLDPYGSILSIKEVKRKFSEFLKKPKQEDPTRSNFYAYLTTEFSKKLTDEEKNNLEILAFTFESKEINEFETAELNSIFHEYKIQSFNSNKLFTTRFLQNNRDSHKVSFLHHTIQEYLAASYILKQKFTLDQIAELFTSTFGIEKIFRPSWSGVVRFLLESDRSKEILSYILNQIERDERFLSEIVAQTLTSVDYPLTIESELTHKIFTLTYSSYQNRSIWLPLWSRHDVGKFCQKDDLKLFLKDIEDTKNTQETYVKRGNVTAIVSDLIKEVPDFFTSDEVESWKEKFIEFANDTNKNGVLQRVALQALSNFDDPSVIQKVKVNFKSDDRLVKDQFIDLCAKLNPNSEFSINCFVQATKRFNSIYARKGFDAISTKEGLELFIKALIKKREFCKDFFDDEHIFKRSKKTSLHKIFEKYATELHEQYKSLLKKIHVREYLISNTYSPLLAKIANLVIKNQPDYLEELIALIDSKTKETGNFKYSVSYYFIPLFAYILRKDQVEKLFEYFNDDDTRHIIFEKILILVRENRGKIGTEIYETAKQKDMLPSIVQQKQEEASNLKKYEGKVLKDFKKLYSPKTKKFFTNIFDFYVNNETILKKRLNAKETEEFKKLVFQECLDVINPRTIKVTDSGNRNFTISQSATFYGELIKVGELLAGKEALQKYRQNIIDFIPFGYSDDQQIILEQIEKIEDAELEFVNSVYEDQNNPISYFLSSSYIYLINAYLQRGCELSSSKTVFKSLVTNPKVEIYNRKDALSKLVHFTLDNEDKKFLKSVFDQYLNSDAEEKGLSDIANGLLITKLNDEEAINWRFEELKVRKFTLDKNFQYHTGVVTEVEDEFYEKYFGQPLIKLNTKAYFTEFLGLLDFSVTLTEEFDNYRSYLWQITIKYLENLDIEDFIEISKVFEKWVKSHKKYHNVPWIKEQIQEIKLNFLSRKELRWQL